MVTVVVDASVAIGLLDPDDAHHADAERVLTSRLAAGERLVLPASAYAEVLVGPTRRGAARQLAARIDEVFAIEPITRDIAARAAAWRARHPALRLPDALVLASGDLLDARAVLTADRRWQAWSARVDVLALSR